MTLQCACPAERGEGKEPLPQQCQPTARAVQEAACSECGCTDWQTASPTQQRSTVFLSAAVISVVFLCYACGTVGCSGTLQARSVRIGINGKGFLTPVRQAVNIGFGQQYAGIDD